MIADGPVVAAALLPLARRRGGRVLRAQPRVGVSERRGPALRASSSASCSARSRRAGWRPGPISAARRELAGDRSRDPLRAQRRRRRRGSRRSRPPAEERSAVRRRLHLRAEPRGPRLPRRRGAAASCGSAARTLRLLVAGRGLDERAVATTRGSRCSGSSRTCARRTRALTPRVVPLLHGGGSPLKFVEALAYGLPVSPPLTPPACSRMAPRGEHFLVAADGARIRGRAVGRCSPTPGGPDGSGPPGASWPAQLLGRRSGYAAARIRGSGARVKIVSVMTTDAAGGAEFAAVEMLDALAERGHEVVMLSDQRGDRAGYPGDRDLGDLRRLGSIDCQRHRSGHRRQVGIQRAETASVATALEATSSSRHRNAYRPSAHARASRGHRGRRWRGARRATRSATATRPARGRPPGPDRRRSRGSFRPRGSRCRDRSKRTAGRWSRLVTPPAHAARIATPAPISPG